MYKPLIDTVIKRQLGILGPFRLKPVLTAASINADADFKATAKEYTLEDLERLIVELDRNYGAVAVMGCKMAVIRQAASANLEIPKIFK